jgi:hypothetical protein
MAVAPAIFKKSRLVFVILASFGLFNIDQEIKKFIYERNFSHAYNMLSTHCQEISRVLCVCVSKVEMSPETKDGFLSWQDSCSF